MSLKEEIKENREARTEQWYNVKLIYRIKYKVDVLYSTTHFNLTLVQPNIKNIKRP